jgi:hypothetical protein
LLAERDHLRVAGSLRERQREAQVEVGLVVAPELDGETSQEEERPAYRERARPVAGERERAEALGARLDEGSLQARTPPCRMTASAWRSRRPRLLASCSARAQVSGGPLVKAS